MENYRFDNTINACHYNIANKRWKRVTTVRLLTFKWHERMISIKGLNHIIVQLKSINLVYLTDFIHKIIFIFSINKCKENLQIFPKRFFNFIQRQIHIRCQINHKQKQRPISVLRVIVLVRTIKKNTRWNEWWNGAAEKLRCNKLSFHIIRSFMNSFIHCLPQEIWMRTGFFSRLLTSKFFCFSFIYFFINMCVRAQSMWNQELSI